MGLVIVLGFVVRLLGRNRRMLGLGNPRVIGIGFVLARDFGRRLCHRLAGMLIVRRLIAQMLVTCGRLAHEVLAGRDLGRFAGRLSGGKGRARNGFVAACMGTLAMAVAAAIADRKSVV